MSEDSPPRTLRERWHAFVAGLVHDLHRLRLPRVDRPVLPLQVQVLEAQLRDLHEVFGRAQITFWLRDGTALGAWRDRGIIPYDDDVDLGLWHADRARVESILPEIEHRGFVVYKRTPQVIGLIRGFETTELCFSGIGSAVDRYEAVRENFFQRLSPLPLLGREFLAPDPIERYLEFCYGADWRVPKIDAWSNSCWRAAPDRAVLAAEFEGGAAPSRPPRGSGKDASGAPAP
jgi:hypothetical protein